MEAVAILEAEGALLLAEALAEVFTEARLERFPRLKPLCAVMEPESPFELILVPMGDHAALKSLRRLDGHVPLVAWGAAADVGSASAAARAGASDVLVLGAGLKERIRTLRSKLEPHLRLRREHRQMRLPPPDPWALIGESPAIRQLRAQISQVARLPRPVLLLGERGSGKELVARAIHDAGRLGRALVAVNCAAFPDALLESELFGHERGSFSGADRRTLGRFEQARGGTLFLDEVGSMSLPFQQKILRVLEYGAFTRVGGQEEMKSDARVIAATNADLSTRIAEGRFLPDLYDRLAFEVIRVPPLRERVADIELLASHFLARFQQEIPSLQGRVLSPEAASALRRYPWPGNVRELKNAIERAAYRGEGLSIREEHLGLQSASASGGALEAQVDAFRERVIREALSACAGNQAEAARRLELTYDQLRHWVRKYQLQPKG